MAVGGGLAVVVFMPRAEPPSEPTTALERYECHRCHGIAGVTPPPRERSCVGCHQAIVAGELDANGPLATFAPLVGDHFSPETTQQWKDTLSHSLLEVPSLVGVEGRLRRDWVVAYLQQPHDLRPGLVATMPRLPISPADAEVLADELGVAATGNPAPPDGAVRRGIDGLARHACLDCHAFGAEGRSRGTAPDLRFTRDRATPEMADRWLKDPAAVLPGTTRPKPDLTDEERRDIVAALFLAPYAPVIVEVPAAAPVPEPPSWETVEARVFKKACWHCHSDGWPSGDGGPGNTGGFGYAGKGLDLTDPAAARSPRIVAHLWARHAEVAGKPVPGVLGMPLGLPPLPPEDIALVEAWLAAD